MDTKKCTACKIERDIKQFESKIGRELKQCKHCRDIKFKNNQCIHNKQKYQCKECGGTQICIHDKYKSVCKECKGSQICIHNKQKQKCKECGGTQICIHNKRKDQCKECKGSQICDHNKTKSQCKKCINPKNITIKNMFFGSKRHDIKIDKYDANNFIDKCFI